MPKLLPPFKFTLIVSFAALALLGIGYFSTPGVIIEHSPSPLVGGTMRLLNLRLDNGRVCAEVVKEPLPRNSGPEVAYEGAVAILAGAIFADQAVNLGIRRASASAFRLMEHARRIGVSPRLPDLVHRLALLRRPRDLAATKVVRSERGARVCGGAIKSPACAGLGRCCRGRG